MDDVCAGRNKQKRTERLPLSGFAGPHLLLHIHLSVIPTHSTSLAKVLQPSSMDDITCTDADCTPCCLVFDDDDCCNCGSCCDSCASSGDGCCLFLGDSLCWCEPETPALVSDSGSAVQAPTSAIQVPATTTIQSQPTSSSMMKILLPSSSVLHSDSNERRTVFCQRRDRLKCMQRYERCPFPSLRVVLVWLFTLAVIAAIGVTLWLTRNIPFGAHCGNAHRALLGVLIVIVIGGICMPVYYKYIQDDLVVKEWHQKHQALMDARSRQELSIISRNRERKRSVVASKRFSLALKVSTLILILVVALGYYYLWGEENQCMDETLWIVKGWFIALLAVAIAVTALMLSAMFRAVKEKRLLKTRNNLDEDEARYNGSIGLDGREGASTQESRIAPPLSPSTPSSVALPPAYTGLTPLGRVSLDQPRRAPDQRERAVDEREHVVDEREHVVDEREHVLEQRERAVRQRERAQIEKALAELDQQEQQFHQDRTDHSQAGYGGYSGASGTGAYC